MERDERGRFTYGNQCGGRRKLPREFHERLTSAADEALSVIVGIAQDEQAKPELRLKAATFIVENAYGASLKCCQTKDFAYQHEEDRNAWLDEHPDLKGSIFEDVSIPDYI